ncbi:nuclear transport factor 2 family protein [Microbacterium sp. cf046]|uniref:nuclear transport factor 2 family protein n=1 Tax=Microbacterium sp. cf046 TaxID=1761803 RepID=UPI0034A199CD
MVGADVDALCALVSDDFTLTHSTGYLQPKAEWLDHIATGRDALPLHPQRRHDHPRPRRRRHPHRPVAHHRHDLGSHRNLAAATALTFTHTPTGWVSPAPSRLRGDLSELARGRADVV